MRLRVHVLNLDLNETLNTTICRIPLSHIDTTAQEFLGQIPAPIFHIPLCSPGFSGTDGTVFHIVQKGDVTAAHCTGELNSGATVFSNHHYKFPESN